MLFQNVFKEKKILITGHTGFKGSWLSAWLLSLGAEVSGLALDPPSSPSLFEIVGCSDKIIDHRVDIRNLDAVLELVNEVQPDFVFHLAAQALVKSSYEFPLETLTSNAIGSANILESMRKLKKPVVVVMITSDKVYDNVEWLWGYRETDRLGGKDPYSASKGMAELTIRAYVESFFSLTDSNVRVGITRAGNVIGGGDWAMDRIVPDSMRAWSRNEIVDIRNPDATRPWQHVLDPLSGYLSLGAELYKSSDLHGEAYNFGPSALQNYSVSRLISEMANYWDHVRWNNVSQSQQHLLEAGLLKLNCDKALFDLKWQPTLRFDETVKMTVEWYKHYYHNRNNTMYDYTLSQIKEYTELAKVRQLIWTTDD